MTVPSSPATGQVEKLRRRDWVPQQAENLVNEVAAATAARSAAGTDAEIKRLVTWNRTIHEWEALNLNPASNVMNPRAEALLAAGMGPRASLGYPGDKFEMGLEALERIEIIATELVAEVFDAPYIEIRVGSGALANLYTWMATCKPGDTIIAPSAEIGGHITHHTSGAAGLYGIKTHPAPIDAENYTVDLDRLREDAVRLRPKLISIGGSINLFPHPVRELRGIADEVGAWLLYDAAHMSGPIAGRAWQQPLREGAHLMTMSTYKSLGGPPAGLVLTSEAELARRIDAIAYPGLTANFDVGKLAALAVTMLDWKECGRPYAAAMVETAHALAAALHNNGLPVHARAKGFTSSHHLALEAARWGGGQAAAKRLRRADLLACGIGLPIAAVPGDANGLRIGTPELVRWGMTAADMSALARLIARALTEDPESVAPEVSDFRRRFTKLHYIRGADPDRA